MIVTLCMATSLDGFITDADDTTSWTQDGEEWERLAKEYGTVILGRTTYEEVVRDNFIFNEVHYYVLTRDLRPSIHNVSFHSTPQDIISTAQENNHEKLLLCGGGETNYAFATQNLIDDMYIGVHPIFLKNGKHMFGQAGLTAGTSLLGIKQLDHEVVQLHLELKK